MGAGFQAFTDTGVYQIDGQTPNYQLVSSMSGQSATEGILLALNDAGKAFYANLPIVRFTFAAGATTMPMYGVYASGGVGITIWSTKYEGGLFTLTFVTEQPCTVYLFLFDRVPPAAGKFGLQVFDASGTLIADSSRPFLRVLDVIYEEYLPDNGWVVTGSPYPQWKQKSYGVPVLAAAIYPVHKAWNYSPAAVELSSIRIGGDTVYWGTTMYGGGKPQNFAGYREQYHLRFMVLDGTGIV
ncbi:hypothetical protein [Burkholderia sp. PU8-34]